MCERGKRNNNERTRQLARFVRPLPVQTNTMPITANRIPCKHMRETQRDLGPRVPLPLQNLDERVRRIPPVLPHPRDYNCALRDNRC